jgi:hypothetical protein
VGEKEKRKSKWKNRNIFGKIQCMGTHVLLHFLNGDGESILSLVVQKPL